MESREAVLLGEVKSFHSFNNTIKVPRGWMQCNGNVINETNYNAIHGSGAWEADGIADLILNGKHTPNLNGKYLTGAATTTQSGASAITSVGNSGNTYSVGNHTHSTPNHNHAWYNHTGSNARTYTSGGANTNMQVSGPTGGLAHSAGGSSFETSSGTTMYTSNANGGNTGSGGSHTVNVRPESIEVIYIIRVGI